MATAQKKGIPEIYVEKDYWVTLALHRIFNSGMAKDSIFKGGTALSKCFDIIERFSEDIDMIVLRTNKDSANQLKNKIKKISAIVAAEMPEVQLAGITNKLGMIRKTVHSYPKIFEGEFGQVR